jgi:hypothetical protein
MKGMQLIDASLPAYHAEGRATTCHDELYPACAIGPQFPG